MDTSKYYLKQYINALQHIPVPYDSILHIPPINLLLLAAKQVSYKKSLLTKNIQEFSEKKGQDNGPGGRKNKTERVIGLSSRTSEEIVKWNQMTALRFQTGEETSNIRRLPPGAAKRADGNEQNKHALSNPETLHHSSLIYTSSNN